MSADVRPRTSPDRRFPLFRLLVLSGATFVAVSSEFLPTGLLPDIAHELDATESQVGLLVTAFAGTVVITTTPLTALTHRVPRKWLLLLTLLTFAIANVLAALAPTYGWLMATRILAGCAHGLFWTVANPYAARMVPGHFLSRAIAVTGAGGSAAFVLGIPLATALGHAVGWRLAFATMGVVIAVFLVLIAVLLPPVAHLIPPVTGEIPIPLRHDRTVPVVVIVCLTVLLMATGTSVVTTYIAPFLVSVGHAPPGDVPLLLFVTGVAGAGGLLLVGAIGDRAARWYAHAAAGMVIVSTALLALIGGGSGVVLVVLLILWNVAWGGMPAFLQTRIMHGTSQKLRDMASAWLTVAFNVSIGGGALIGGLLLDAFGIGSLVPVLVAFFAAAIVLMLATDRFRVARHPS